jgi:hypothetical protein
VLLLALVVGATQGGFRSESGSVHVDIANELRDPMTEDERHGREVFVARPCGICHGSRTPPRTTDARELEALVTYLESLE